ncbi:MAG TPA: tetratricopeptide repeat protein [Terracidiphilus sp.]|nr:tetratricopeptide repeat protein [Terracidiphilus sp.]
MTGLKVALLFPLLFPSAVAATHATAQATPAQTAAQAQAQSAPAQPPVQTILLAQTPPTQEEISDSLMNHKRYQEAIASYKTAIAATHDREDLGRLWNKLGIAYQMMYNYDEAIDCYRKSLHLRPHSADVLNNLGTVYDAQKDYRGARSMYKKAIKLNPHAAVYYKNFGTSLLAVHKYGEGWRAYQSALAIDPQIFGPETRPHVNNPATLAQRGAMNYYMARGCAKAHMPGQAIEYLRRAIDEGFVTPGKLAKDGEFASLRDLPAFKQLLADQKREH